MIVVVALLASVLPVVGLALLPPAGVLIAAAVLLGFVSAPLGAVLGAALLDSVDDRLHGRVLGAQNAVALIAAPLAIGATSVVVEFAGTRIAGIALASLWAIVVLIALLSRSIRRVTALPTVESTAGAGRGDGTEPGDDDPAAEFEEGSVDAQR